jgi:hypothetical protein
MHYLSVTASTTVLHFSYCQFYNTTFQLLPVLQQYLSVTTNTTALHFSYCLYYSITFHLLPVLQHYISVTASTPALPFSYCQYYSTTFQRQSNNSKFNSEYAAEHKSISQRHRMNVCPLHNLAPS